MSSCYFKNCFSYIRHIRRGLTKMPPLDQRIQAVNSTIDSYLQNNKVMIFSKSYCPFCQKVKGLFTNLNVNYFALELDQMEKDSAALLQDTLKNRTGQGTVPNVFINGQHIGGCDATFKFHEENKLLSLLNTTDGSNTEIPMDTQHSFDYDLIVIGGGSGGLAASKEAAKFGKKVAVCDFVKPTPIGTAWGLGGTCVNVGCIPKKLMHQASLLGLSISDASAFGWQLPEEKQHKWDTLIEGIQNYIGSLNWGYRVALKEASVTYLNEFAEFVDKNTIKVTNKKGQSKIVTSNNFIVAVGGRPRYPNIPGALENCITSDDLFSLPYNPGKTLCVGASYIALECAGFLAGFGNDTTVMVRSILLRGFDQQMAEKVGEYMTDHGVKFLREWVPISVEKIKDGSPPTLLVKAKSTTGDGTWEGEFNTVIVAIGRDPCTADLKLDNAGINVNTKNGKIITNAADQTNENHIYAIGDVAENRPELTPVAIQAGVLLAKRLFAQSKTLMDYDKVPTTVFTPLEYGCIGLSEEEAISRYGEDDVEVYHTNFQPLETAIPKRDENKCYLKLVCIKSENERVVGFHYLGPNAGEVTQGYGLGIRLGATKSDFDALVGIHPTCSETFTTLAITKSSGLSSLKKGC